MMAESKLPRFGKLRAFSAKKNITEVTTPAIITTKQMIPRKQLADRIKSPNGLKSPDEIKESRFGFQVQPTNIQASIGMSDISSKKTAPDTKVSNSTSASKSLSKSQTSFLKKPSPKTMNGMSKSSPASIQGLQKSNSAVNKKLPKGSKIKTGTLNSHSSTAGMTVNNNNNSFSQPTIKASVQGKAKSFRPMNLPSKKPLNQSEIKTESQILSPTKKTHKSSLAKFVRRATGTTKSKSMALSYAEMGHALVHLHQCEENDKTAIASVRPSFQSGSFDTADTSHCIYHADTLECFAGVDNSNLVLNEGQLMTSSTLIDKPILTDSTVIYESAKLVIRAGVTIANEVTLHSDPLEECSPIRFSNARESRCVTLLDQVMVDEFPERVNSFAVRQSWRENHYLPPPPQPMLGLDGFHSKQTPSYGGDTMSGLYRSVRTDSPFLELRRGIHGPPSSHEFRRNVTDEETTPSFLSKTGGRRILHRPQESPPRVRRAPSPRSPRRWGTKTSPKFRPKADTPENIRGGNNSNNTSPKRTVSQDDSPIRNKEPYQADRQRASTSPPKLCIPPPVHTTGISQNNQCVPCAWTGERNNTSSLRKKTLLVRTLSLNKVSRF